MSEFGRSMLEKFGWKEGKGLGKEESGISKPIKVNGNFNAYGLGHDVAQEFTNQWWDHLYNRTAGSVSVGRAEDGSVQFTRSGEVQVSQKVIPYANAETSQYSRFVKAGVLTNPQEDRAEEGEAVSYDEVFKISGGRTAHKGARHGLTMAAKLARVEKQERELLNKWKTSKTRQIIDHHLSNGSVDIDKNDSTKKKQKYTNSDVDECISSLNKDFQNAESEQLPKKHKKRKKIKVNTEVVSDCAENEHGESLSAEYVDEEFPDKQRKSKKKMAVEIDNINGIEEHIEDLDSGSVSIKKKHKKKHRKSDCYEKENAELEVNLFKNEVMKVKKKKRTKESYDLIESVISGDTLSFKHCGDNHDLIPEVETSSVSKKKKKKQKN